MYKVGDKVKVRRLTDILCEYNQSEMLEDYFGTAMFQLCSLVGVVVSADTNDKLNVCLEFEGNIHIWITEKFLEKEDKNESR